MSPASILETRGLRKQFGGVQAVSGVSLSVSPGDLRAIIGPNGAGKTTLFSLISGDLTHDSGQIFFAGDEVSGLGPHRLCRLGMGRTFQITSIFRRLTAFDNVQTALLSHHGRHYNILARASRLYRAEAFALLERVGLEEQAGKPSGILAHGDQRRLELAIALASAPRLLLLDEPTAGMAPRERHEIMGLVAGIARDTGLTLVFTEHDMDVVFAVATRISVIADALALDPLEFRLRNIVREGDEGPTGQVLTGVGLEECLRRAAAAIGWADRRPGPGRGKGLACGWWTTTGGSSGVYVKINPDGTVALHTGAAEIGTAALTGAAQVLAEELGIELADVTVVSADTFATPFDFGAQGSRTAFAVGNACRVAADELKRQLLALAAAELGADAERLTVAGGHVVAGPRRLSLAELARLSQQTGGGLIAHGTFIAPPTAFDAKRVEGHVYPAFHSPSFHAHAVDLSVDAETGEIAIHKYVVAQDVGFAINPGAIEGQIEGGVAQGLGQALSEEIVYEGGRVLNATLTDYKMPTALDMPRVESILVEHPSAVGPYGAKGVGEPPNIEPPAAVANAVAAATGLRITSLPITAEKIALARADPRPRAR